jgi:four helix bundle protein
MATIQSFETLEVWKKARELSQRIYTVTLIEDFSRDFALRNQINRASGSIMDNIAEGFERGGRKEFIQFLSYAKGSAGEVKSQLCRVVDRGYISKEDFEKFEKDILEIGKMIGGLINYLKKTSIEGVKYLKEPMELYETYNFDLED